MTPKPQTEANRRRERVQRHQLRQTVNRQKRLVAAHRQGKHTDKARNCPVCCP